MTKQLVIAVCGDSISATSAGEGFVDCWPYKVLGIVPSIPAAPPAVETAFWPAYQDLWTLRSSDNSRLLKNMAISGSGLSNIANGLGIRASVMQVAPAYVDPVVASSKSAGATVRKYLYICFIGSNDHGCLCGDLGITGAGDPVAYSNAVATSIAARKTAGFDLTAICTLLPRDDATMTEVQRAAYNSILTPTWAASKGIDYVIDFASDSIMGVFANTSNATWYQAIDRTHPTDAGQARLAVIAKAVTDAAYASF